MPEQSPAQPMKALPVAGVAVRVTVLSVVPSAWNQGYRVWPLTPQELEMYV